MKKDLQKFNQLPEDKLDACISEDGKECCFLNREESCVEYRTVCIKNHVVFEEK